GIPLFEHCNLIPLDVPKSLSFYKKKARGLMLYYMTWMWMVAKRVEKEGPFDVIHLVNFHTDVYPHFLRNPHGKLIWGPLAHHPFVPPELVYQKPRAWYIGIEYLKYMTKQIFWRSPWMIRALENSDVIFCCNSHQLPPSYRRFRHKIRFLNVFSRSLGIKRDAVVQDGPFQLLFIGRFMDVKGTIFSLEVFRDFWKEYPNARFTMIGKGPLKDQIVDVIEQYGLEKAVNLVEWLPQEELVSYYQRSHVFFYPSMEAQGMVVTEAMQFGVPILCLEGFGPHSIARECAITVPFQRGNLSNTHERFLSELRSLHALHKKPEYTSLREKTRACYQRYLRVEMQIHDILDAFGVSVEEEAS
ncbi:MAG: glycosyltransferase family 4 protein, partial [Myxococcota bacterium]|nr:glycosyltransferase family 4 protein [Myxococcota bacterium]